MKPSDLRLPYQAFTELVKGGTAEVDFEWLAAWELLDQACSPMDDRERRLLRYGHYLGWHARS